MKQNIQSVLRMTGDILSDPNRRCVGTEAEDAQGYPVSCTDTKACRWCLLGALKKSLNDCNVGSASDQLEAYNVMKSSIGLDETQAAPLFWDNNEGFHQMIANKLRFL